jgi:hypothetical protein
MNSTIFVLKAGLFNNLMYKKITYRRASKFEPGISYIKIWNEPTTNKSLAALELLNESFRKGEADYWTKQFNFTQKDYSEYDWNKCSSSAKLKILRGFFNRRFLEKSDLICHYCKTPNLLLQEPYKKKKNVWNLATIDHKIPLVEEPDWFDASNLLVCCNKCNNKKGNMSYKEFLAKH